MKNATMKTLSVVNSSTPGIYYNNEKHRYQFDAGIFCDDPNGLTIDLPGQLCVNGPIACNSDIEIRCDGLVAESVRANGFLDAHGSVEAFTVHSEHGIFVTKELRAPKYIYTAHGNIVAGSISTDGDLMGGEIRAFGINGKNQGDITADNIHAGYGIQATGAIRTKYDVIAHGDIIMNRCEVHGFIRTGAAVVVYRGDTSSCRKIEGARTIVCCNI